MKVFRVTFKGKDGVQYMRLVAKDAEEAKREAERAQFRRHERFPLTFARLEEAAGTGKPGGLAIAPHLAGKALTEAWVNAEIEKRKRDQGRYDNGELKVVKVEEVKV